MEGVERLTQAADLALTLPPAAPPGARERTILVARVLAAAASASSAAGSASAGRRWAEEAVALARRAEDDQAAEAIREVAEAVMVSEERTEYDAAIGQLRNRLDATALDSAGADGRRLTTDEAVALALAA